MQRTAIELNKGWKVLVLFAALCAAGSHATSQTLSADDGEFQFGLPGIEYTIRPLPESDTVVSPMARGSESGYPMAFHLKSSPGRVYEVTFSLGEPEGMSCQGRTSASFAADGLSWREDTVRFDPSVPQRIRCDDSGVATLDLGLRFTIPSVPTFHGYMIPVYCQAAPIGGGDTLTASAHYLINMGGLYFPVADGTVSNLSRGYTYSLQVDSGTSRLVPVISGRERAAPARLWQEAIGGERVEFTWTLPTFLFGEHDEQVPCSFGPDALLIEETGVHLDPHTPSIVRIPANCYVTLDLGMTISVPHDAVPGQYSGQVIVDARYIDNAGKTDHLRSTMGGMELLFLVSVADREVPKGYSLLQNYPNPFNGSTEFTYGLPEGDEVKLSIVDLLGREVAVLVTGFQVSGWHTTDWSAENVTSGLSFYRLRTPHFSQTGKLLLVR